MIRAVSILRRGLRRSTCVFAFVVVAVAPLCPANAQSSAPSPVLTEHNDISRTGDDLSETALTPQTVVPGSFGKLWNLTVKGRIYAQPLYVPSLVIGGKTRNVVFIASAMNNVYAYDADKNNALLWSVNLGTPVSSSDYNAEYTYLPINPYIGIIGTPVIDQTNNTLFCVANTTDGTDHHFFLHALNLLTGADQQGSPVEISGSYPGVGAGSSNGTIPFSPFYQLQRPALLLSNGVLYIAFGGHQENPIGHGWLFAYSESPLTQLATFCSTPNGGTGLGSFWASGQGPAADDDGNVYAATGNGAFDIATGGSDYAMSILKLQLSGSTLAPLDYFTPWDVKTEDAQDKDLGVCGPLLIPGSDLLLQSGKDGHFYLIDLSDFGEYNKKNDSQIVQDFQAAANEVHGSPVYWQSDNGAYVYVWSQNDYLKQFQLVDGLFNTTPVSEGPIEDPLRTPGGSLSISANGTTPGSGIVWALLSYNQSGYSNLVKGVLRAYNADNVSQELWDSYMVPSDEFGFYAKFVPPTIANGKVYVATDSGHVTVYGLLPAQVRTASTLHVKM